MCRLAGWVSDEPRTLAEVLGERALARLVQLSTVHGHGWGLAYLDSASGQLRSHRSTAAARSDPDFVTVAHEIATTAGLVHLRWATPGFGWGLANTHPFVRENWAMMHNGAIGPAALVSGLRGRTPEHGAPAEDRQPLGSTDSESFFLAVLDEFAVTDQVISAGGSALAQAVARISDRAVRAGLSASSLNSMFLGPSGVHVLNWHDATQVPDIMLSTPDDPAPPPYYDLCHLQTAGLHVVVSSGFVEDLDRWTPLPNESVLSIDFAGGQQLHPVPVLTSLCRLGPV